MAKVTRGAVSVAVPDSLVLPEQAGRMSKTTVKRLLKAPRGLKEASESAASALEKVGAGFVTTAGLTPESLREAGARSEALAGVVHDLEMALQLFKQAGLLLDYEAHEKLRLLNDLVKAQAKYHPELRILFRDLIEFFSRSARTRKKNQKKRAEAPETYERDRSKTSRRRSLPRRQPLPALLLSQVASPRQGASGEIH